MIFVRNKLLMSHADVSSLYSNSWSQVHTDWRRRASRDKVANFVESIYRKKLA